MSFGGWRLVIASGLVAGGAAALSLVVGAATSFEPRDEPARVRFVNVARERGVDFEHFDPVTQRQYISETIGGGAAWIDVDADGWLDLVLVNSAPMPDAERLPDAPPRSRLYRNRLDGTFEETSDLTWQCGPGFGQGCATGDFDNDGFDDLYVTFYLGPNRLFQNNGDGTFSEIAARAGATENDVDPSPPTPLPQSGERGAILPSPRFGGEGSGVRGKWSTSAAFGDLDGDGDLDLYVCNYLDMPLGDDYPFCGDKRRNIRTVCSPAKFADQPDVVYENLGDHSFRDASKDWGFGVRIQGSGVRSHASDGRGLGVVIADLDGDGLVDVYVANDLSPNLFYRNLGGGRFREEGLLAGCALSADGKAQAGMGVDVGDVDGDGRLDIFVTNFFREPNSLFQNQGGGRFREISARSGLGRPSFLKLGFGCGLFDADNDGNLDVFVANGHIDRNPEAHGTPEPYRQPAQLFLGDGRGRFVGITDATAGSYWQEPHVGRAAAFGDFDNDGRMDIAVNNNGEPAALLHNESGVARPESAKGVDVHDVNTPFADSGRATQSGHWLRLVLVGTSSNRSGVGTRVTVTAGESTLVRELAGGRSFLSAHDPRLLVGLGADKSAARLEIRWPNGKIEQHTNVRADQTILFREP